MSIHKRSLVPSVFTILPSSLSSSFSFSFSCYYCLIILYGIALIFQQTIIIDAEKQIDTAIINNNVTDVKNYDSNYTTNHSQTLSKSSLNNNEQQQQQQLYPDDQKSGQNMELVDRELMLVKNVDHSSSHFRMIPSSSVISSPPRKSRTKSLSKRPNHHNLNFRRNRDRLKSFPYAYAHGQNVPEPYNVNIQPSRFHYHYPYSPSNQPQIRIIERPLFIERRSDTTRGKLVSQIVNRASQAFHNLIEHRRNRSKPRLAKFMSERRSSGGRLFPRVREHFVHRIESRKPRPPEPQPPIEIEQLPDIQFAESRIDGNDTSTGSINDQISPSLPEFNDDRPFYREPNLNYELEGRKLRQDIVDKVTHLQTILDTAFHVSRERRDLFLSRLLRNTNNRLERAKNRADQILSEPATSELAVKTLHHINSGINNMYLFLHNLLNRVNVSIKVQMKNPGTESSSPSDINNNNINNSNSNHNGTTSQTKNDEKDQQSKENE
ncbi:uncharacterized protein LOC113791815 isoform X1 [Dermatophagoides pteronyssinus]|uniref:uncharacterized protein LOC113791815 isoform X1 n=1 Tax=Dermatophagoides pteronyssinus TaxID=6956 RepID=UPI003F676445